MPRHKRYTPVLLWDLIMQGDDEELKQMAIACRNRVRAMDAASNNGGNNMTTAPVLTDAEFEAKVNDGTITPEECNRRWSALLGESEPARPKSKRSFVAFDADAVAFDRLTDEERTKHARLMMVSRELYDHAKERDERHRALAERYYRRRSRELNKHRV